MPVYLTPPPQNPLTRVVAAIVALLVLAGAFMLGLVALAIVAGLGLAIGLAAWIRAAWNGRRSTTGGPTPSPRPRRGQSIEAEYTVVSRQEDSRP